MLTKTITFKDFLDQEVSETLYFNLTKTELADMLDIMPRLEEIQTLISGLNGRDLTTEEIRLLVDLIKHLVEKSYGVRSSDGKRFDKSPGVFADFVSTAAYDAFVWGLFTDGAVGFLDFMNGIFPQDLIEGSEMATVLAELPKDERPVWIRENREPTQREVAQMSTDELREAYARKSRITPPTE